MAEEIPIFCPAASGVTIDFSNILIKAICPEPSSLSDFPPLKTNLRG